MAIVAIKHNTAREAAARYIPRLERVQSASFAITPAAYSPLTLWVARRRSGSIGVGGPTCTISEWSLATCRLSIPYRTQNIRVPRSHSELRDFTCRKIRSVSVASKKYENSVRFRSLASIGFALTIMTLLVAVPWSEAATHKSYRVTYSYACCSWKFVHTNHRPGARLMIRWSAVPDSSPPNVDLKLTAWIVGPFSTSNFIKDGTQSATPGSGLMKISAIAVKVSNSAPQHPVSVIFVPRSAKAGYYELWTKIVWLDGSGSGTGATIIHVSK